MVYANVGNAERMEISSQQEKSQPSATKQKFQEQAWKLLDVSKTF